MNEVQNHMDVTKKLLASGDFLNLSRQSSELFSSSYDFCIDSHTDVHIYGEGLISFQPKSTTNQDIILSSGIHGNETAPIEICDGFVRDILRGKLILAQRVLFIFGNLKSMDIATRFVEENMNRLFSGHHQNEDSTYERARARILEQVVTDFYTSAPIDSVRQRLHYDLHTAIRGSKNEKFAVYPFLHGKDWDKNQLQILLACGVKTILLSGNPTSTFSYFSSHQFSAHAFTVELGKVMPFGENDMGRFENVIATLTKLICGQPLDLKDFTQKDFLIYKVNQVINKQHADFTLHFADDVPNFSDFTKGALLASETGREYRAEYEGEAIVFPNAGVEIGQRALLTVIPTDI